MFSASVLQYPVKPSLRFGVSLLLMHVTAAVVVCASALPWPVKLVMLLLICLSLVYYLARDVLLLRLNSWCEISLDKNSVSVTTRAGTSFIGLVANETFVSPYFVVLCLRLEGHRLPVSRVIFPDALNVGEFRELCVRLRFA